MTALDTTVPIEPHQRGFGMRSRGRLRTYLIATLLLAAAAAVVAGCGDDAGDTEATEAAVVAPEARSAPTEDTPASRSPTASAPPPTSSTPRSLESDPGSWPSYTSTRYDFTVGHPSDWTEVPSSRGWSWETDIQDWLSPAHEAFIAPDDAIRVSAWNAPLDASAPEESIDDLVAWVEDYCERSANTPCTGIADRAVELCLEARDCHPGLLVPFSTDVQAFFSGGIYDSDAMTIVAVWRSESHPSVAPYGGAQRLLESLLSTMDVWPATTPFAERN